MGHVGWFLWITGPRSRRFRRNLSGQMMEMFMGIFTLAPPENISGKLSRLFYRRRVAGGFVLGGLLR